MCISQVVDLRNSHPLQWEYKSEQLHWKAIFLAFLENMSMQMSYLSLPETYARKTLSNAVPGDKHMNVYQ